MMVFPKINHWSRTVWLGSFEIQIFSFINLECENIEKILIRIKCMTVLLICDLNEKCNPTIAAIHAIAVSLGLRCEANFLLICRKIYVKRFLAILKYINNLNLIK